LLHLDDLLLVLVIISSVLVISLVLVRSVFAGLVIRFVLVRSAVGIWKCRSDLFGVEAATALALYSVEVELGLHGLVQTLVAHHIHLELLQLLRQVLLGFLYLGLDLLLLALLHLVIGHAAGRAVQRVQLAQAFYVNQVAAAHGHVALGGVE